MIDTAVFAIPAKFVAGALVECGEKQNSRCRPDSVGLCRSRRARIAGRNRRNRQEVQRPPDGAEYLRLLLYARQSLRDVLHRLRRQGPCGAVVAVRRHRHGDHRLLALGQDGRLRDRRSRQQVGYRRGRSARLLRAGPEHDDHRAALRRPEGRPCALRKPPSASPRRSRDGAQGRPHVGRRQGCFVAHRRARRQRQDLRGRAQAVRRDPRPQRCGNCSNSRAAFRCCRPRRARTC